MILLPHGCSCSEPAVNPKNWATGPKYLLNKKWRIHYYFRDPEFKDKYPYGKLISIRGMNGYKTLEERRQATQLLIDEEIYLLKSQGYNPITKAKNGPELDLVSEISPLTKVCEAIDLAVSKIEGVNSTLSDLSTTTKYFKMSCTQLRYNYLRISDLKRAHVKNILENQRVQNNYTNERYNKIRAYMMMVFKELVLCDAIEYNLITGIPKKKETRKIKETLSDQQLKIVKNHLKKNHYEMYRYMEIFFHSGCRTTELFSLKKYDIDIKNQRFKVLVKKGKQYEEQWRGINKNVLVHWQALYKEAKSKDYIFSYNFSPGETKIAARQVSNKWRKYVKLKLGIDIDFYSLKHLHTTKVIDLYSRDIAAGVNGHKSNKMNDSHYDTMRSVRIIEETKTLDISL